MSNSVLTEVRGRVLVIILNRPEARNAVESKLAQGLVVALERLDADDALSTGVLAGNGSGFCSGMDLKASPRPARRRGSTRSSSDGPASLSSPRWKGSPSPVALSWRSPPT